MSLGEKLSHEVKKEAAMKRPLPLEAQATHGATTARVVLRDHDRLGGLAERIEVKTAGAASTSSTRKDVKSDAKSKANEFARRVTYLPERLGYVETDAGGTAVLRSTPATMRGRGSEYYEAKVSDNEVALQRFKPKAHGGGREQVPFHVTDDTMQRIVDDAAQTLEASTRKK